MGRRSPSTGVRSTNAPAGSAPYKPAPPPARDAALKPGGVQVWGWRPPLSSSSLEDAEVLSSEDELARLRAVCAQQAAALKQKEAQLRSLRGVDAAADEACQLKNRLSDAATGEMQTHSPKPQAPGAISVGDEQPSWLPRRLDTLRLVGSCESSRGDAGETDSRMGSSDSGSATGPPTPATVKSTATVFQTNRQAPLAHSPDAPVRLASDGTAGAKRVVLGSTGPAASPSKPARALQRVPRSPSASGAATRAAIAQVSAEAQQRAASRGVLPSTQPRAAPRSRGGPVARLKPHELRVYGLGWLDKFSRGGLTSNWNRRVFALIGCTLFYAKSVNEMVLNPKIFLELDTHSVVGPWCAAGAAGRHTFSITTGRGEVVLLAADSEEDRQDWSARLGRARGEPHCDVTNVAALIHYAVGSESLFQQVRECGMAAPSQRVWCTQRFGATRHGTTQTVARMDWSTNTFEHTNRLAGPFTVRGASEHPPARPAHVLKLRDGAEMGS